MRFQKEFFENEVCMDIHTDKDLTKYSYGEDERLFRDLDNPNNTDQTLGKALEGLRGIAVVDIAYSKEQKYTVSLQRGSVFNWDTIAPKAIEIIKKIVAPRSKTIVLPNKQVDD